MQPASHPAGNAAAAAAAAASAGPIGQSAASFQKNYKRVMPAFQFSVLVARIFLVSCVSPGCLASMSVLCKSGGYTALARDIC